VSKPFPIILCIYVVSQTEGKGFLEKYEELVDVYQKPISTNVLL
jgi:hypothetical protein